MPKLAQLHAGEAAPHRGGAQVHRIRLQPRYFAFLSYSHRDKALADWLYAQLEKFRVPHSLAGRLTEHGVIPTRLTPIFRDEHELAASHDLGQEIRSALATSQFLIVLCSPNAAKSHWTNAEIEAFKRTRPDGEILAAIASGEPFASDMPGREEEECFPPALRQKYDRRGRPTGKRAEPLAADLRGGDEGRRIGFLKLVAGMLGVGLDELVQRETTRRQRRLAIVAAASLGGMAVTSTLAVAAIQARDAAREERRQAEGLVAYMVGDLKDKLEPIGKLDALDGVATRVLAYYRKQDTSQLSDAALLQRARALSITAQVAAARGKYDEAQALYRQALAGTGEAVRRSPEDTKRLFEHAQNVFWLGEVSRYNGQPDEAVAAFSEYKRLADRLVALEPDNLKWRMEGLYGVENTGISLFNKRRYADADRQFESTLAPMQNLVALDPRNPTYQEELPKVLGWIAEAKKVQGQLAPASAARARQISLLNQALATGSSDVDIRSQLIIAHQALGLLLASLGQTDRAIQEMRTAVDQADRLVVVEPANAQWKGIAAGTRIEFARVLLANGRRDEASQQANAACEIAASIKPPSSAIVRRSACLVMQAKVALQSGAYADALASAEQALPLAKQARSDDRAHDQSLLAAVYRVIGDARKGLGDDAGAMAAWSQAFATLPKGVAEWPSEMDERATIFQRLGRTVEAQQIASALNRMNYRRLG